MTAPAPPQGTKPPRREGRYVLLLGLLAVCCFLGIGLGYQALSALGVQEHILDAI